MLRFDGAARAIHCHGALYFVSELTHVTWPPVLIEEIQGSRTQMYVWASEALACLAQKKRAQVRDFLAPVPQRRDMNANDVEAMIEVLAEFPFLHPLLQIRIGGREHPYIDSLGSAK